MVTLIMFLLLFLLTLKKLDLKFNACKQDMFFLLWLVTF